MTYDFLIIGSGITGASIARELSKYNTNTIVLEKENDAANHATTANSAIIHSGYDPDPNSLKAKLNVEGNKLYDTLEEELDIPLFKNGAFMVAHDKEEEGLLERYLQRAITNGVPGVEILDQKKARELEPNLADSVTKVLNLPSTKVTYPWEVALASLENAIKNGVTFEKNKAVKSIEKHVDYYLVTTEDGSTYQTRYVINAAGAFAEKIAKMVEKKLPYHIRPRKGEYLVLDRRVKGFLQRTLYPTPDEKGKGILLVPQYHGNILIGPNSETQGSLDDVSNSKGGLNVVKEGALKLAKNIPFHQNIRTFAGVRASSTHKDFYIKESLDNEGFIHVAGIDSPGLTAAPAIAKYVVETIIQPKEKLNVNEEFNPYRRVIKLYDDMTAQEKEQAFNEDSRYGNLVCKCERITEGDIVRHIHREVKSDSVKAVKKRARAGAGICQGGYCEYQVIKILARELGKTPLEVNYFSNHSNILKSETKVKK